MNSIWIIQDAKTFSRLKIALLIASRLICCWIFQQIAASCRSKVYVFEPTPLLHRDSSHVSVWFLHFGHVCVVVSCNECASLLKTWVQKYGEISCPGVCDHKEQCLATWWNQKFQNWTIRNLSTTDSSGSYGRLNLGATRSVEYICDPYDQNQAYVATCTNEIMTTMW